MKETMIEKLYREAASLEPRHSPWGSIDGMRWIANGIYSVCTPSHGGIMVHKSVADNVLSKEAQEVGFESEPFICFEEDCDAPVAIRELLDKGLMKSPVNDHFKEGEYSACINDSIKRWNPEYWETYEKRMANTPKREARMTRINGSPDKFREHKQNAMNEIQKKIRNQKSRKSREREER